MSREINAWERLTAIATLGTRRGASAEAVVWPTKELAAAASPDSLERTLLRAAAATLLWQSAGQRASINASATKLPEVPESQDPLASEAASMRLIRMISGDRSELIAEWFELADAAGRTLAPQWLPIVLDGVADEVRNAHPKVLGPTAAWLARLNREWVVTLAVDEPSEQRWQEGTLDERRAELACVRKLNPAQGRRWLEATWASDPPDAREIFLETMQTGVSAEDEPFLEAALDDKRKGVRHAAVAALALLPHSAHARRIQARLLPLIELEPRKGGLMGRFARRSLTVELPASIDKAAQRDGIELKPPAQRKIGERAFWLSQMVALVAPAYWNERFDCDAETFIQAAMHTEHGLELLSALSESASRHADAQWLSALCEAWLDSKQEQHVVMQALTRLIAAVPASQRGALFESQAQKVAKRNVDAVLFLIDNIELNWTPAITELAFEQIAARARSERQTWSHPRNALDGWARRCDVPTAARLLPNILSSADEQSPWRNALEQLNDTVEFRAAMKRELM